MAGPGSAGENAVRKDGKLMVSKGLMVQNPSGHFKNFLLKFVGNRVMRQREDEAAQRISAGCPVPAGSFRDFVLVRGGNLSLEGD